MRKEDGMGLTLGSRKLDVQSPGLQPNRLWSCLQENSPPLGILTFHSILWTSADTYAIIKIQSHSSSMTTYLCKAATLSDSVPNDEEIVLNSTCFNDAGVFASGK